MKLNRELVAQVIVALVTMMGVGLIVSFPALALASESCGSKLGHVEYKAAFDWMGTSVVPKTMQLRIGAIEGRPEMLVAQIVDGSECQAVCQIKAIERSNLMAPVSMDLDCRGNKLNPLAAPATLFWAYGEELQPTIRFGTWLNGYQEASLRVEMDGYAESQNFRNLAQSKLSSAQ